MKLNDFIKQESVSKKSNYKVVIGNSPKEQELTKVAGKVEGLSGELQELQGNYDKVVEENEFLKGQVKRTQNEIDEFKGKLEKADDLKVQLLEKENRLTDVLEESHELTIKENTNKDKIKDLETRLSNTTGEFEVQQQAHKELKLELESMTSKYNGISSELNRIKDFSEKTQDEYNKTRDRNTVLMREREDLSILKTEFEVKSIRLGDELNKAQEVKRILEDKLVKLTNVNINTEKDAIKSNNLSTKLKKDLDKVVDNKKKLESELVDTKKDIEDLSDITHAYKKQIEKERHESMEWNIAKQELRLGNAKTYPNKIGFGSNPFFKLAQEN